ncbi:hypothetical protein DMB66_19460 [Actinoplanes sp. ATCC 53533]|uniref:hypothetical protein n=1 Tax=Actinoplanes sp. ATCC 53533 TaxID=1288362 RepID=UPI000F78D26A|nr:hypothetical protein [Actinoplanes sp. ATCC 53533]RSM64509.1 hypothetical protein DMB66_19460 [Actinoplanes sp. ATCC 53533]
MATPRALTSTNTFRRSTLSAIQPARTATTTQTPMLRVSMVVTAAATSPPGTFPEPMGSCNVEKVYPLTT